MVALAGAPGSRPKVRVGGGRTESVACTVKLSVWPSKTDWSPGGVTTGATLVAVLFVAEKLKWSMARPCALPVGSAISHTSQRAPPGGQLAIPWLTILTLVWLTAAVPSTGWPPTAPAAAGIFTSKPGSAAVTLVANGWLAVGSTRYPTASVFALSDCRQTSPVNWTVMRLSVLVVRLMNFAPKRVGPLELVARRPSARLALAGRPKLMSPPV